MVQERDSADGQRFGERFVRPGCGPVQWLGGRTAARTWTDPCGDLDSRGSCDGDVAQRCTNILEGRRRMVSFDCSTLGMACNTGGGQVSCDGNVFAPPPPPPTPPGGKADPRGEVDR